MKTVIAAALLLVVAGSATAAQARANFNLGIDVPAAVAFMPPPQVVIASSNFHDGGYRPYMGDREHYRGSSYGPRSWRAVERRDERRDDHRGYAWNERRDDHRGGMGERH